MMQSCRHTVAIEQQGVDVNFRLCSTSIASNRLFDPVIVPRATHRASKHALPPRSGVAPLPPRLRANAKTHPNAYFPLLCRSNDKHGPRRVRMMAHILSKIRRLADTDFQSERKKCVGLTTPSRRHK